MRAPGQLLRRGRDGCGADGARGGWAGQDLLAAGELLVGAAAPGALPVLQPRVRRGRPDVARDQARTPAVRHRVPAAAVPQLGGRGRAHLHVRDRAEPVPRARLVAHDDPSRRAEAAGGAVRARVRAGRALQRGRAQEHHVDARHRGARGDVSERREGRRDACEGGRPRALHGPARGAPHAESGAAVPPAHVRPAPPPPPLHCRPIHRRPPLPPEAR